MTATREVRGLVRPVARLALPVILTNLLQTLVNVVDVFMAGRLGPVPVAAVGLASTVALLVILAAQVVTAGGMALAAQARGANDPDELTAVVRHALVLALVSSLAVTAVGLVVTHPLLAFMNSAGDPLAVRLGTGYLRILFFGTAALFVNLGLASLWQGAGDTVTPLLLGGVVSLLNVGFDYLFMFGPGPFPALGVPGAGLGTVAAWTVGAGLGLALLVRGRTVLRLRPGGDGLEPRRFGSILAIGAPASLQGLTYTLSRMLLLRVVTSSPAGTLGAAALAIGIQIESLAYMPGVAVSVAATSLVGQALGAWQAGLARRRGHAALAIGLVVMGSIGVVLFAFAPWWIALFEPTRDSVVIAAGIAYLRINALALPVLAVYMVLTGSLRGAGDTRPALLGTLVGRWLVTLPVAWVLALHSPLGVTGAWWAMAAGTLVQALWVARRWISGRWLEVALRRQRIFQLHLRELPHDSRVRFLDTFRTPLLALPGSRELVDEAGVVYVLGDGRRVDVRFDPDPRVAAGHDAVTWLDAASEDRSATASPPRHNAPQA